MRCNSVKNQLIDFVEGNLTKEEAFKIQSHINSCTDCKKEIDQMQLLFGIIAKDSQEIPSKNIQQKFAVFLEKEQQQKVVQLQPTNNWKTFFRVAASILIVITAFVIGKYQSNPNRVTLAEKQQLKKENRVLTLLKNQSASKRIKAIDLSQGFNTTDHKIIDALIAKLFNDENINVRLAAAEALSKFSSLEKVKAALIKSLETEKAPSMQIELIQILAKIQEKRALKPMKKLLQDKETPNYVKQELQYNIASLL